MIKYSHDDDDDDGECHAPEMLPQGSQSLLDQHSSSERQRALISFVMRLRQSIY